MAIICLILIYVVQCLTCTLSGAVQRDLSTYSTGAVQRDLSTYSTLIQPHRETTSISTKDPVPKVHMV